MSIMPVTELETGLAELLNEIESAGGLVTPEQEAKLAGYAIPHLVRAAIALKAVHDELVGEMKPHAEQLKVARDVCKRHQRAYDRIRETLLHKAEAEGWTGSGAVDPDDLASVSFQETETLELIGDIDDVPAPFQIVRRELDEDAVWEEIRAKRQVPGVRVLRPKHTRINLRAKGKALVAVLGLRRFLPGPPAQLK